MPISGFPELLPAQRIVELTVLDRLRRVFELHGFTPLETAAVESLDQLLRKVILPLDDETLVRPGHGPQTTIGRERRTNPFLQGL